MRERGSQRARVALGLLRGASTVLLVAGCARYHPRPLALEETAGKLESRTLSDAGLRHFFETNRPEFAETWPRKRWGLQELTLAALYYNSSLRMARADWVSAKAAIATAAGRPNPTLTAGPGYNFSAAEATPWLPFASLDWPIETAGKRGLRMEEARRNSDSSLLNLVKAGWQARSRLRAALVDLASASQREQLLGRQIKLQERALELMEQRRKAGAVSGAELSPARLALQKLRVDASDALRQAAEARAHVAEAVAVPSAALNPVDVEFDLASGAWDDQLLGADARRRAVVSRVEVLEAASEYAASEASLHLEIAKQYPDVHINPGYQLDDGQHKASFGVSMELPLLNQNQGPIAEAKARRAAAAARVEAMQSSVIAEVDRAVAMFRIAETNLAEAERLLGVQQKQVESMEQQYKAGAVDRLDLTVAQLDLAAGEAAVLDSRSKKQQALGALEDAVQRPLDGFEPAASMLTESHEPEQARRTGEKKP